MRDRPATDPRGRPLIVFGPPGACDACALPCLTLDQVGIRCYHCHEGVFQHRSLWRFEYCPGCHGPGCSGCSWRGIVATPAE